MEGIAKYTAVDFKHLKEGDEARCSVSKITLPPNVMLEENIVLEGEMIEIQFS